ncbi:Vacuolar cation/proton exchanger 2 [Linum perenne]
METNLPFARTRSHLEVGGKKLPFSRTRSQLEAVDPKFLPRTRSQLEMVSMGKNVSDEREESSLLTSSALPPKVRPPDFGLTADALSTGSITLWQRNVYRSIIIVVFSNKLNLLMPFGPLAILLHELEAHNGWVFLLTLLGIIPLAERLGYATEQLAFYTGPTVGGLLNATFGNATELIIATYALRNGMRRVVQLSLLGSILSNMLLVLGSAFFAGGLVFYRKEQVFDKANATVNSGLLLMAVMGLVFPAVLHSTHTEVHYGKSELALSRFSSCVMLLVYAAYLFFQLNNNRKDSSSSLSPTAEATRAMEASDDDDDEPPEITKLESIIWLSIMTTWISVLSEYLVDAIEGASLAWNIPIAFIGVILLPIVGNAAEHTSAVMFAMKDKLIPFCVVVGWIMGQPMDLNFQLFETAALFITVIVVAFFLQEGTSNYFKGLMLILCYVIIAASFYVHEDPSADEGLKA